MKRRSSPPLYELIRSRAGERSTPQHGRTDHVSTSDDVLGPTWLSPGRTVQFPVGYVFVAGAAVLILLIGAYMLGFSRGKADSRLVHEDDLASPRLVAGDDRVARDPLESMSRSGEGGASLPPAMREQDRPAAPNGQSGGQTWGPIQSDPRQPGVNYFVLMETNEDGAMRLAEYCRERGLETYVVSGNNRTRRFVIALPGFEAGQRASAAVRALESKIHSIGDSWKQREPGASDLRDAYPNRFGG